MTTPLRVLELFCGIGGCAAALGPRAHVVAAIDINRTALDIYARNFPHMTVARTIESIPCADYRAWASELWWLSPPCQPYTRRGRQRDLADPRAAGLSAVIQRIADMLPRHIALENVPPFQVSQAYRLLCDTLDRCRYRRQDVLVCPTALGIPNRRQRFYLVASRDELRPFTLPNSPAQPLAAFLDDRPDPALAVSPDVAQRYASALDIVDIHDKDACSSCFTAAYGRSYVRSGSYVATPTGLRRFAPGEILRLLGFPESFRMPDDLPREQAWHHIGNSLSVVAVRCVLAAFPALADI
jgi:DNA (cytosine-5)-methyltransferase 1